MSPASMNLTQRLAMIQRNQQTIDLLTANNSELMNGIIMENTLSNLARVPGLPPQLSQMIQRVMNGEPLPDMHAGSLPVAFITAGETNHHTNGKRRPGRPPGSGKVVTKAAAKSKTPAQRHEAGFYDAMIIGFAKQHGGKISLKTFRDKYKGTKGISDTFFKTTMYTKVTSMTQGPQAVLKKIGDGEYELTSA